MPRWAWQRCTSSIACDNARSKPASEPAGSPRSRGDIPFEVREVVPDLRRGGQRAAATRERLRRFEPQRRGFAPGGREIRRRRTRILGAIEMLGMKRRVAVGIPGCRAQVQRAAVAVQQRRVRAVADERVNEAEPARVGVVGAHQIAAQEHARVVRRIVEQVTQHREIEALADDSGRLHRCLVGRRQPVEPAQHDALDRGGNRRAVGAAAQELREEQRVALRALDALRAQRSDSR